MLFCTEPETLCWEWSPTVFEGNDNGNRNATTAVRDQTDFGNGYSHEGDDRMMDKVPCAASSKRNDAALLELLALWGKI